MSLETAQRESFEIQELVAGRLYQLGAQGHHWTLLGGSTEDDGAILRVTIVIATRYAESDNTNAAPTTGAMADANP